MGTGNDKQRLAKEAKYSASRVRELLDYDPSDGIVHWKVDRQRLARAGDRAGSLRKISGYRVISLEGNFFFEHRLIWIIQTGHWPLCDIDHVDGNRANNKWDNIREASRSQNVAHTKCYNKLGLKGISPGTFPGHFRSSITKDGKPHYLGTFSCAFKAHEAYLKAAKDLFGEFARA